MISISGNRPPDLPRWQTAPLVRLAIGELWGDWGVMREYADEMVRVESVAHVAIVDRRDAAIVHTDGSFRGGMFREPRKTENAVRAQIPVTSLTRQVATIRVGVNVGQR